MRALLDTGSAISLLKSCHAANMCFDDTVDIQCVHGDVKSYPSTVVIVCVFEQTYLLKVAVVESLPTDMILGKNLPILPDLLHGTMNSDVPKAEANLSCPVVTRAKAKAELQPLPDLHHSLIQGGTKVPQKVTSACSQIFGYSRPRS